MNHVEYLERMRKSRQFTYLNVEPQWVPGEKDIDGFIHDEVVRQFHDPREERDGGVRIRWMRSAWDYAMSTADTHLPNENDVLHLGALVEAEVNRDGYRLYNVQIGNRLGAAPGAIPLAMNTLMRAVGAVYPGAGDGTLPNQLVAETFEDQVSERVITIDDWYLAYEWIHPFGDGNGRTGKILHNWLSGTLDDPILVPDYFGGGNP